MLLVPSDPVIHIDDSDVIKPNGYKFEALEIVRNGSECISTKFLRSIHLLRKITSPPNTITFSAIDRTAALFCKATDVIRIAKIYFSRQKIEEYFRCKKQTFQFKNFRMRKLKAISALNFYITACMVFLAMISMESETNALKKSIIKAADPIK